MRGAIPVFIRGRVPVVTMSEDRTRICQLRSSLFFSTSSNILCEMSGEIGLATALTELLRTFLSTRSCELSIGKVVRLL